MVVSRLGVANATSDGSWDQDNQLFLKTFAGEVLTAFKETNVFKPLHLVRTIDKGKSASFPATWKANASYHVPGNPVLGSNQIEHNERVIVIDDLLISDVFIYNLDEAKNHYDVRSIYSYEVGSALAREFDQKVARVIAKTARSSSTTASGFGGTQLVNANAGTDGEVLASLFYSAAQALDEKDVPERDRYGALRPAQYYLLTQTTKVLNQDWGGEGSYARGKVPFIADIAIVKSNNVPSTVVSATAGENNDYSGDFSNTVGLIWHKTAVGTVKLMDLAVEMTGDDFRVMYQGDLIVAKYAVGHGILRPECAVEVATA
jgi:hypothetical protein